MYRLRHRALPDNLNNWIFAMSELSVFETRQSFLRAGKETLDPSKSADVPRIKELLAAPYAVRGLADNGKAAEVVALVKALPHDAQTTILAAPYAVSGLAYNGKAADVEKLKAGWKHTVAVRPLRVGISDAPKGQEP